MKTTRNGWRNGSRGRLLQFSILLLAGLLGVLAPRAQAAPQQMQITFGGYTNRSEVLTNFPVLVVLSNNVGQNFTFADFVTTNGTDLRFYTTSAGTGDGLNYEIESWNTNAGQACYVWVQVPTIPSNGTGSIYSKWGDSANSNQLACTTNGAVWTNGCVAVWHLPNGTALSAGDATSNRNNGTISPSGATAVTGVIDGAARFDGVNGLVTIADSDSLDITNRFAISVWFKPNVLTQNNRYILSKIKTGGGDNAYSVVWEYVNNQVEFYSGSGAYTGSDPRTGSGMTIGDTNWHHVVYSYDGATWCGYLDGTTKFSTPRVFSVLSSTASMYLSTFSGSGNNIDGQLDEVRVESTARSSNWVWACYQNQASNTVFNNYGAMNVQDASSPAIRNDPVTSVATTSATFNGTLTSTGSSACAVGVYWGQDTNAWANTNWFNGGAPNAGWTNNTAFSTNITTLTAGQNYYYTFGASNTTANVVAGSPVSFITGELTVQATDPTGRSNAFDTAAFTVTRPATCTNENLIVNYTLGGTATNVTDYAIGPVSGAVVIAQGQTNGTITVTPVFKMDVAKTVILTLTAGPYAIGTANSATCTLAAVAAVDLTWTGNASTNWDTATLNWTNAAGTAMAYADLAGVTFNDSCVRSNVNIVGTVIPASVLVTNATRNYTFSGGAISGVCGLVKSGSGTVGVGYTYTGLIYTGATEVAGGVLRIDHNSGDGGPSERSLKGTAVLNGGTLRLNHTGPGYASPTLTFTNPIQVTANGGTLDLAGGGNGFVNTLGPLTLGGALTVSGITGNSGVQYYFANPITLTTNATITNATGPTYTHTVNLNPNISGATRTLTLGKVGTGTGFQITGATATSLNLGGLTVGAGSSLFLQAASGINPVSQIKANGGALTLSTGANLTFQASTASPGPIFDPSAVAWQGGNALLFERDWAGNNDSYMQIADNLTVSTASGLIQLTCIPWRALLTITAPKTLTIGNGGTLVWTVGSTINELVNGNVSLLNGATVRAANLAVNPGGLIRGSSGTLTLGDGSGTPANPSVVTVTGDHGANTIVFNLGYPTANMVESGTVKMRYANTSTNAGSLFSIGWSAGGAYNAALTALRTTSGGTEFAPLAAGGVGVVGATSGTVATFTNAVTVSTAGTVGFYNAGANNVRGALGAVVVSNGCTFAITNAGGLVVATNITVSGGTVGGIGTFAPVNMTFTNGATYNVVLTGGQNTNCGLLAVSNTLAFSADAVLTVNTNAYAPTALQFWYIASATAFSGLPTPPPEYSLAIVGNQLKLTKLSSATAPSIENRAPTNIFHTAAVMNGFLNSTGTAPTTVSVFWGTSDGGSNTAAWAHTNTFASPAVPGAFSTNLTTLVQDQQYYYRYYASNSGGDSWPILSENFITGDVWVNGTAGAAEDGPVTGQFTVSRSPLLTNESLVVAYTVSGTASNGVDHTTLPGTVTIPAGAANAPIYVAPIADSLVEGTETVTVTVTAGFYVVGSPASASISLLDHQAKALTWTGSVNTNWDTATLNWTGDTNVFGPGDLVTFNDSCVRSNVSIVGTVAPGSVLVTNATKPYTFSGGALGGPCALVKGGAGTLAVGYTYTGLVNTGGAQIDGGIVQIDHNNGAGGPSDRSLRGPLTLNGGMLRLQHTGAQTDSPTLTFTNAIQVTANGGTLDLAGGGNGFVNTLGPLTLGGVLTVSGITGNSAIQYYFANPITLTANATITNATGPTYTHTVNLNPNISGATRTLTLGKAGTGTGFEITSATATSLNLGGLTVGAGSFLTLGSGNGTNPLAKIAANGGVLTMGTNSTLYFLGSGSGLGPIINPPAIGWQGGGTLDLPIVGGGNGDSYWEITSNLVVSAASGLTRLNSRPFRGYMTVDAPYALTIGTGGTYSVSIASGLFYEYLNGNLKLLDGATVLGANSAVGGMIRGTTGALTLGDGSGTPANPSVVTVTGNHGAGLNTFNLGYGSYMTESGTVQMKYASTSATAGSVFNVGWCGGGAYNAALTALRTTSGGTEFAPLAGGGGVAVVGPTSGTVATFTNTVTVSTAGTVGFYNAGANNVRGALGAVVVTNGGSLSFTTNGVVAAGSLDFAAGSTLTVTAVGTATNAVSYLRVSGTLNFASGVLLNVSNPLRAAPPRGGWYVAEAATITGQPTVSGYGVVIEPGSPARLKITPPPGSVFTFR